MAARDLSGRIRGTRPASAMALAAVLGACTVGPRYQAPAAQENVPATYPSQASEATTAQVPADAWWREFSDPVLDQLVDAAFAGSPDLLAAEDRVGQARSLAAAAGAHYYPELNLGGRVGDDKLSLNSENLSLIPFTPSRTQFVDYRVGFDASWEIDLFGHTRHQVEAAVARMGSVAESANDAKVVLAAEVVRSYLNYRIAQDRIEVAKANEAAYTQTARLVDLEFRAGWASELEVNRAEADRLSSTAVTPALDADRRAALFRLASLTALALEDVQSRLQADRPTDAIPATVPVGLPADLLRRRPDVRRAERDLAAATGDAGVAVADQFPRISLVGEFGLDSVHPGELFQSASRYWAVGPQFTVPLFSAGRLRHQSQAAEAARAAALESYRSVVLNALADAETALVRLSADRNRLAAVRAATARLGSTLDLTRLRYRAGEATLLEVMDAERTCLWPE